MPRVARDDEYRSPGRVNAGRPEIFPVNYVLDASGSVVFRTSEGTKLASAVNHPVVFEIDAVDAGSRAGWSVVVHGVAHHSGQIALGRRRLDTWLPVRPFLVRITATSISGRRTGPVAG